MREKMPSWALFMVTSCLLLVPPNQAQVTNQGEVYRGWRLSMLRQRESWEGNRVKDSHWSPALTHKPDWKNLEPDSPTVSQMSSCWPWAQSPRTASPKHLRTSLASGMRKRQHPVGHTSCCMPTKGRFWTEPQSPFICPYVS